MTKTILLSAAAVLLAAAASATTGSTAMAGADTGIIGDDYARYSSVDGPNSPLMQSFAPNRDDALLTDIYGPYDYLFLLHNALDPNTIRTASTSGAGPTS